MLTMEESHNSSVVGTTVRAFMVKPMEGGCSFLFTVIA